MKRIVLAFVLIAAACHRYEVPVGQWLWRIDGSWNRPAKRPDIRIAPATILALRPDREYVEMHCWVIERPDETVYIASNSPRVTVVGRWRQEGGAIIITRQHVGVSARFAGSIDPFCAPLTLHISGKSVAGNAGGKGDGLYAPVTRLVAPDFESYVKDARSSPKQCSND